MTFTEIQTDVASRLNLTSTDALTRIGIRINDRYRRITSSIGLITSRRVFSSVVVDPVALAATLPDVTIPNIEKVLRITMQDSGQRVRILKEVTYDDITNRPTVTATPKKWAVKLMDSNSVTITLDGFPATTSFTLKVEAYAGAVALAGTDIPAFPADFHDIIVEGVMSDELRKMEKPLLFQTAESNYNQRLSDLRMFIAKSSYLDIAQGKHTHHHNPLSPSIS